MARMERSAKVSVNCAPAMIHSCSSICHASSARFKTKDMSDCSEASYAGFWVTEAIGNALIWNCDDLDPI
jgi:hypothetical protein